jgi:hypothetical protein
MSDHDALVEAVAMALCENMLNGIGACTCRTTLFQCADEHPGQQARAAIAACRLAIRAEALEETAKVAKAKADEWATAWRKGLKCDSHLEGKSDGADEVADAILALKEKSHE